MKKTIHGTTNWIKYDTYRSIMPISRWVAFRAFIKGRVAIHWQVPTTRKDKRLKLTGYTKIK